jgi:type II secretory pathway pseudopilin PulG
MKSFPCNHQPAFTLLEVVAGLTLMATVLVASLLSFSAHHRQRRLAESKLAAVAVADELLGELSASREGIPRAGRGMIPGQPTWFWQTRIVAVAAPAQVPLQVIRLEVVEVTAEGSLLPLATVEVVEPIEA